ncbi:MAG: hypothetical protein mread185_000244 [Mycoplasmataceae bacterium]|nr:MAG: hypothetical protein mread185_000244 [Mycoplasmataceae bacterium]
MAASTTIVGRGLATVGSTSDDEELTNLWLVLFEPGATSLAGATATLKTTPHKSCSLPLTLCKNSNNLLETNVIFTKRIFGGKRERNKSY